MWRRKLPLGLLFLAGNVEGLAEATSETAFSASSWYDWGLYGPYPQQSYESFGAQSPKLNLVQTNSLCDDGLIFIAPRGVYVDTPGPVILDRDGNLVWMQTAWGQAMDFKVQQFRERNYMTFWNGAGTGTYGDGHYIMLDESYQVFKTLRPVGNFTGDLHEFRITEDGTALMTIYHKIEAPTSSDGLSSGWIYDSLFQEIDIESGELLFEWHASQHFTVPESKATTLGKAYISDNVFDFFHINSIDKDGEGNYLISSRYMWAVLCISHEDGRVLWQLGGDGNDFQDLSDGAATNISWNHHATWQENMTLTIFDNGSNGDENTAEYSRGLMIELDLERMTATLIQSYVSPQKLLASSQGSVQILPNDNVLVGWGQTPAFTEFSMDGKVLCDTHLGPIWLSTLGWVKNYRVFKFDWVGRPMTVPDIAVRPRQQAIFVSWNGATEVDAWVLQSGPEPDDDDAFMDHETVAKTTFETRISIPSDANEFVRVVALDVDDNILGYSNAVSKRITTITEPLQAPSRTSIPEPATLFALALFGLATAITAIYYCRSIYQRVCKLWRKYASYKYQLLPTS